MTPSAVKLLEEALKLSPEVRAALAASLLESLDEGVDEDAEAAWAAEITKRLRELDTGAVAAVPWSEARRMILGR
jgi:putative addiction module component (TIGR02574 family)